MHSCARYATRAAGRCETPATRNYGRRAHRSALSALFSYTTAAVCPWDVKATVPEAHLKRTTWRSFQALSKILQGELHFGYKLIQTPRPGNVIEARLKRR